MKHLLQLLLCCALFAQAPEPPANLRITIETEAPVPIIVTNAEITFMYTVYTNQQWMLFYRWPLTPTNGIWVPEYSVANTSNWTRTGNECVYLNLRDTNNLRTLTNELSGLRFTETAPNLWPGKPQLYFRIRRLQ